MDKNQQKLYQKLYDNPEENYGQAKYGRCPGVRLLPLFKKYIIGKIIDFGCGTGDTIFALNKFGVPKIGYDFIKSGNIFCKQVDITEPIDDSGNVGLCLDVFEHIDDEQLVGLINNLRKCQLQIISIHNGVSKVDGVELHINCKSFIEWKKFLNVYFVIIEEISIHEHQKLYICERKEK